MIKNYLLSILFLTLLIGCGGKPYEYQDANEVKPGPGLFSGDEGELYLIKAKEKKDEDEAEADKTAAEEEKKE